MSICCLAYVMKLYVNLPLKTTPEFSLTVTGAPLISVRNPDGSRAEGAPPFSIIRLACVGEVRKCLRQVKETLATMGLLL